MKDWQAWLLLGLIFGTQAVNSMFSLSDPPQAWQIVSLIIFCVGAPVSLHAAWRDWRKQKVDDAAAEPTEIEG